MFLTIITSITWFLSLKFKKDYIKQFYRNILHITLSFNTALILIFWPIYFTDKKLLLSDSVVKHKIYGNIFWQLLEHFIPFIYTFISLKDVKFTTSSDKYILITFLYYSIVLIIHKKIYKGYPYKFMKLLDKSIFNIPIVILFTSLFCLLINRVYLYVNKKVIN
ncbi:hypothetical protein HERIO_1031 [Hepatospora eriocheir]|uniref:Uncharacterized protein n=1 Tax=Hepatospora eriocheir TaxID=1081669 RepID=A0A1X0QBI1_9MICR|nr:hypothetical protein HERIO_1031 [Hepatospora eriocheir]